MTQQDKNLFIELGLTFLLLITAVFSLKPAVFWQYQLFLIGGSLVGFIFGWYNRKGAFEGIKYFIDAAILIVMAWIGYWISKSSFLYQEVIAILIQGVIVLEIIFSFNFSAPGKLAYIWILSILVFMTSPIFASALSVPLAIVYLLIWLAILRLQFAKFSLPFEEKGVRRYYSLTTSLVCFLVALLLAWFISANVFLGRINKGKLLLDEDLQDMGTSGNLDSKQADKFYSLQDTLQKKITDLAFKLDSYEKKRQLIYLFSELIKESMMTMQVDKAEIGLIDILKRPGEGLEGTEQIKTLTKEYLGIKISLKQQIIKEDMMSKLRQHSLGIIDKIKITSLVSKVQQAGSYQQQQENSRALQSAIQNSPLAKDVQKDLKQLARKLSDLKSLELYRRKIRDLEQKPPSFGEEIEKKIADTVSDIKHTQALDDFKQTAKKIRQLKNDSRILEQKSGKDTLKSLEETSRMKLDLLFTEKVEEVREDVSQKQNLGSLAEESDRKMDQVENARNYQEFIKAFSELSQQNKDNNSGLAKGLSEVLDLKTESFKQAQKDKIDDLMNKDFSSVSKKEITGTLEIMEEKESPQNLKSQQGELVSKIKDLEKKSSIPPESAVELLKAIADFKDLLEARLQAEADLKKNQDPEKNSQKSDYAYQLQQAIEDSSLSSQKKEMLKALLEQLLKAQNLSQLEEVKEALENEISSLGLQDVSNKDRKNLSAAADNASADLEKKIDNLENITAEQIKQLQEYLKKMQQAQDARELQKNAQEFKEAIKSNIVQDKQDQAKMLEAAEKLEEMLASLLEKKTSSAKDLEKKIDNLENITAEQIKQLQEYLKKMQQAQDNRELQKIAQEFKEAIKSNIVQDKQDQAKMLEAAEKLEEMLASLLEKKTSSAKDLEKKIDNLENITAEQIKQLQEYLKKMQQAQDNRELQKIAQEFKEAIKSNIVQDKQDQAKMLEAAEKLEEILGALFEKRAPTVTELKEINKINEKIKQAAEIKQQFLASKALADILKDIERLNLQDTKKAQALKEKLEQLRKSDASEEVEKIILDLKNIINSESAQTDKDNTIAQEDKQQWEMHILPSPLIVSLGINIPLKVIAVYKNGYVKELTADVEWFSTEPQIAKVGDFNFLYPLAKGNTKIRGVYKGVASKDTQVNVVEDIDGQTVQLIKQDLLE